MGMYYHNLTLVTAGLIAFFIVLPICLRIIKLYGKNKDTNINYDKYKNK
jgi:preprotein translocase subunit SecG